MPAERHEAHRIGGKRAGRRGDGGIAELAAGQHGVVSLAQLLDAGLTRRMIDGRLSRGHLHRLHRGVFALGHAGLTPEGRWLAAVFACGEGALLSHASAAALWRIRDSAATLIDVSSPGGAGWRHRGIRLHEAAALHPADTTSRRGIPCTSLCRTVLDCAASLHPEALEYMVHRAQTNELYERAEMEALLRRSRGRRGVARLRAVLGHAAEAGDGRAKSRFERAFFRLCRRFDLPLPQVNAWIPLPIAAGGLEVDFSWPEHRLVVEVDSRALHLTDRAFRNDRARDRALAAAGWRVLRYPADEITRNAHAIAAELRTHLTIPPPSPPKRTV